MATNRVATTRERLREIIDDLPENLLTAAEAALTEVMEDGIPLDDEPVTEEDLEALAELRTEQRRGETILGDVVRREFGW